MVEDGEGGLVEQLQSGPALAGHHVGADLGHRKRGRHGLEGQEGAAQRHPHLRRGLTREGRVLVRRQQQAGHPRLPVRLGALRDPPLVGDPAGQVERVRLPEQLPLPESEPVELAGQPNRVAEGLGEHGHGGRLGALSGEIPRPQHGGQRVLREFLQERSRGQPPGGRHSEHRADERCRVHDVVVRPGQAEVLDSAHPVTDAITMAASGAAGVEDALALRQRRPAPEQQHRGEDLNGGAGLAQQGGGDAVVVGQAGREHGEVGGDGAAHDLGSVIDDHGEPVLVTAAEPGQVVAHRFPSRRDESTNRHPPGDLRPQPEPIPSVRTRYPVDAVRVCRSTCLS